MVPKSIKLPFLIKILIFLIALLSILFVIVPGMFKCQVAPWVDEFAIIVTLCVLIVYTYYTFVLANEACLPSASFELRQTPKDPYHFNFIIRNYSKLSLRCWCNLNAKVHGKSVVQEGFYDGSTPFDVQPFGTVQGHFGANVFVEQAGTSFKELESKATDVNLKQQLTFNIDFSYNVMGAKQKINNPRQPFYLNFKSKCLVMDF